MKHNQRMTLGQLDIMLDVMYGYLSELWDDYLFYMSAADSYTSALRDAWLYAGRMTDALVLMKAIREAENKEEDTL